MKRLKVYMVIAVMLAFGLAGCPKSSTTPTGGTREPNATTNQRNRQGTTSENRTTPSQPNQPGTSGQRTPAPGGGTP
jgi:hypothetical protein